MATGSSPEGRVALQIRNRLGGWPAARDFINAELKSQRYLPKKQALLLKRAGLIADAMSKMQLASLTQAGK